MNRPIKFRGRVINTGEFVFGDLAHTEVGILIDGREVDPESIAQFVGHDKNGAEVYEGDIVWNPDIMSYQSAQLINNYEDEHITLKEAKT